MDYTDAERAIFEFHDGTGPVKADPQIIHRNLAKALKGKPLGGEYGLLDTLARGDYVVAYDAAEILFPALQAAFHLSPLQPDGTGCTEAMQYRVLMEWLRFKDGIKKKRESLPG